MEDKACYEYHVLSHEAICIFVTPVRRPMRIRGQTTHYADNALFDERKSRSLTFNSSLLLTLLFPPSSKRKKGGTVKYFICVGRTSSAMGYLFFWEMQIHENHCPRLTNINWHDTAHVRRNSEREFYFYI